MARVNADPESLRALRDALRRGQEDISRAVEGMRGSFKSAQWNDDRRTQFERELEGFLSSVTAFSKEADELKEYLSRKADDLDRYLGR
ncbi:hypothetical protein ABIE18_001284 [Arthrobacter sp. 2762]|jgi:hypothetical protein|uniref:hypothetical protein n=1 Tax=Paenarthrobacter sp. 2TAF44 TaxID=3233018 RepID=UPI00348C3257